MSAADEHVDAEHCLDESVLWTARLIESLAKAASRRAAVTHFARDASTRSELSRRYEEIGEHVERMVRLSRLQAINHDRDLPLPDLEGGAS